MKKEDIRFDDLKGGIRKLEGIFEVAVLTLAYFLIWKTGYEKGIFPAFLGMGKYVLMLSYAILIAVFLYMMEGLKFGHLRMIDLFSSQLISILLVNFVSYLYLMLIANQIISVVPILILCGVDLLISFLCVYFFTLLYHGLYVPRDMVMVYGNAQALDLKFKMDSRTDKYRITELLPEELGLSGICRRIDEHDAVIINDVRAELRNDIVKYCYQNSKRTYIVPKISDVIVRGAPTVNIFDTPLLLIKGRGLTFFQRFLKRTMDLVLAVPGLVIASPIMLLVAIAIKLDDHGPVFFKQERVTRGGKTFRILKFRSMVVDADKHGVIPTGKQDDRITRVGRFIRATRLDELPQILNIVKGDMSIVGPRPERVEHVDKYTEEIPEFSYRLKVRGGLTGYAQIYGKYNTSAYDKLRLDLFYIENYSIWLDIKLILMTLQILLKKESTEGFGESAEQEACKQQMLERGKKLVEEARKKGEI